MATHNHLGQSGEALAAGFLEKRGYLVIDRNVRQSRGEIDIIAREGGDLVFIEVKTRSGNSFGSPAEAVTPDKIRKTVSAISEYISHNHCENQSIRCDVVAVTVRADDTIDVEIIKHAFEPGDYS